MGTWESDADTVVKVLREWCPILGDEAANEEALYRYLNERFEERVDRQYTFEKSRADFFVKFNSGAKVAIELKANLTDRNEYNRVVGQVYVYLKEWQVELVVVVCGDSDPTLVKSLGEAIKFFDSTEGWKKARLVVKPLAAEQAA